MHWAWILAGCTVARHPVVDHPLPRPSATSWEDVLSQPGVIAHEAVVSARWAVPLRGVVNTRRPEAEALEKGAVPIVLPVHVLTHPTAGVFVVDTGLPRGRGPARGLLRAYLRAMEPLEPLGDILARHPEPIGGVLLTHLHIDHVLGLPDVPVGTPIHAGPGELEATSFQNAFTRGTVRRAFRGHGPLRSWVFDGAASIGPIAAAVDLVGDGTLWALATPGHTPGSTAYLALTTDGPTLFVGDTSHTRWGWAHGVEPGAYTEDHAENRRSLLALKALVEDHPGIRVFVGHELDGEGTGVTVR